MALSQAEFERLRGLLKTQGPVSAPSGIGAAVGAVKSTIGSTIADIPSDIGETFKSMQESWNKGIATTQDILGRVESGQTSPLAGTYQTLGAAFKTGGEWAGAAGMLPLKAVSSPQLEAAVGKATEQAVGALAQTVPAQALINKYQSLTPEQQRNVDATLGIGEGLLAFLTAKPAETQAGAAVTKTAGAARTAAEEAAGVYSGIKNTISDIRSKAGTLFTKPAKTVDEVVNQAASEVAKTRQAAEAGAVATTIKEQWAGITPDVKKRLEGKAPKLQEYFDVAHARNLNDTLPTPYEFGAQHADTAVNKMESLLSETGGAIGATRKKLGTYQATPDQMTQIERNFESELNKLNLTLANGEVVQMPGKVAKASASEVNLANTLYRNLKVVKQSPTVTNLIDYRSALDAQINFAKSAREATNTIDPLARSVRSSVANTNATIVGAEQAKNLEKYSNFMSAYDDLRSYTDRKAGGEYLLRLVLSGRGGEARQIIQTIKEYTGMDLMDDATMMKIATDLIGNDAQKNLFRQEAVRAGLDVASAARGNIGAVAGLVQKGLEKTVLKPEKIYMQAAQKGKPTK